MFGKIIWHCRFKNCFYQNIFKNARLFEEAFVSKVEFFISDEFYKCIHNSPRVWSFDNKSFDKNPLNIK